MSDQRATVRSSLAAEVDVRVFCQSCQHNQPLDLAEIARRGHAAAELLTLPLRCRCGSRRYWLTVSGRPSPPGSVSALIAQTKKPPGRTPAADQ